MRSVNGFWWRWLAVTLLAFGATWGLMAAFDVHARPWRLLLLVAVVMAVLALANVSVVSEGPDWTVDSIQSIAPPGQDTRLGMYTRVISGHLDARRLDPSLRDRLADLADRRLRQRRGIGLRDPGAVDALGDDVSAILTGAPRRLSRAEIETCVRTIEEL
jgi:hypothetical protein